MKKMKLFSNTIQWANVLGMLGQFFQVLPPAVQGNKYIMAAQGLLGVLLPSLHGIGHTVMFGTSQTPDA